MFSFGSNFGYFFAAIFCVVIDSTCAPSYAQNNQSYLFQIDLPTPGRGTDRHARISKFTTATIPAQTSQTGAYQISFFSRSHQELWTGYFDAPGPALIEADAEGMGGKTDWLYGPGKTLTVLLTAPIPSQQVVSIGISGPKIWKTNIDVRRFTSQCGDSVCDAPFENRLNCPQECPAGQSDGVCDVPVGSDSSDGVCDLDCIISEAPYLSLSRDIDCRELVQQAPFTTSDCRTTCYEGYRFECERDANGEEIWSRGTKCVLSCEQGCMPPQTDLNRKPAFPCVTSQDCLFIDERAGKRQLLCSCGECSDRPGPVCCFGTNAGGS